VLKKGANEDQEETTWRVRGRDLEWLRYVLCLPRSLDDGVALRREYQKG